MSSRVTRRQACTQTCRPASCVHGPGQAGVRLPHVHAGGPRACLLATHPRPDPPGVQAVRVRAPRAGCASAALVCVRRPWRTHKAWSMTAVHSQARSARLEPPSKVPTQTSLNPSTTRRGRRQEGHASCLCILHARGRMQSLASPARQCYQALHSVRGSPGLSWPGRMAASTCQIVLSGHQGRYPDKHGRQGSALDLPGRRDRVNSPG